MSKYHYGPYSSLTPRLQSSNPASDLYSAHGLLNQLKSQQRSETLSPDGPKKSPTKSSKPSKSQLENQLRSSKGLKKTSSKTTKGKTKKSNSPPNRDPLAANNGDIKKKPSKPQINTYEIDNVSKHKSSSVKSLSIPQSMFNQPGYEANFANWLSEKVKSPKNANVNSLTGPIAHSADLNHPEERFQGSDSHNVWPETKKTYKIESQSHRQSLESPTGTTPSTTTSNAKKSLQNQLSAFAGNSEGQKSASVSLAEGDKAGKSISKQKLGTQKLSLGSKDQIEAAKKLTLKVSPRNLDPYIGLPHPLSTQSQTNTQPKMNSLDAHSLGSSSYNFEFQKDAKRVSLDPSQSSYSNDQQLLDFPRSAKNQTKPKGNFFKDSPPSKKDESSGRMKDISPRTSHEESKVPARLKSAKHSDPNIYNDLNAYMSLMLNSKAKRASDSQLQVQAFAQAQAEGEGHVLSNRSAMDKYENRLGLKSATIRLGENLEDSVKASKKGESGNGKSMTMKSQMQEKRSKANFKSADWGIPGQNNPIKQISRNEEPSPEQVGRYRKNQEEYSEDKEGEPTKGQLYQILHRTEQVLTSYKHKENTWGREKKELLAEVKYLRSVIEKMK